MKLPIPLLLYVVSLGLFGLAGWTVYQMLPMWKSEVREKATRTGQEEGKDRLGKGRAQGPQTTNWLYTRETATWWAGLKLANLTGKLPPPPPDPAKEAEKEAQVVVVDQRPLDQIIELIGLVYDGESGGKGGNSHIVVRFKPEANVQPPEYWVKENMAAPVAPGAPTRPMDTARGSGGKPNPPPAPQGRPGTVPVRPPTAMPTAPVSGREFLQKLWVQDGGDPRRSAVLWPVKSNDGREIGTIRLVRVAPDAQSAFFVRELPPAKAGDPPPEPKEEELIKTAADLSQDILKELRILQGRSGPASRTSSPVAAEAPTSWMEVEETTLVGNVRHIGRKDQQRFRDGTDDLLEQLNVDTYVSSKGTRGLIVKGVDQRLASSFGVTPGEVLLEINGKKVESKAQAVSQVKADYKRGVRTFTTKWMANGQVVDRTYQAPEN